MGAAASTYSPSSAMVSSIAGRTSNGNNGATRTCFTRQQVRLAAQLLHQQAQERLHLDRAVQAQRFETSPHSTHYSAYPIQVSIFQAQP